MIHRTEPDADWGSSRDRLRVGRGGAGTSLEPFYGLTGRLDCTTKQQATRIRSCGQEESFTSKPFENWWIERLLRAQYSALLKFALASTPYADEQHLLMLQNTGVVIKVPLCHTGEGYRMLMTVYLDQTRFHLLDANTARLQCRRSQLASTINLFGRC